MLETLREYQYTIAAIVILVGAFAVYQLFFSGSSQELVTSENQTTESDIAAEGARIQSLLSELERIDLSGAVLEKETYRSLTDYSQPLTTEPIGREDPFASSPGVVDTQSQ
jgi:hypothetical protein